MLGKREKLESDENDKTKIAKLSVDDTISNNIFISKSNPSTFICSYYGSICINEDRNLISFGYNEKGYLGHEGINEIINPPKQIPNLMNIKMIDCGCKHTACIDYEGSLFTFGKNTKGQLGIGKDKNELPFTHIPQRVIDIPPVNYISCGYTFTICITKDRNVYSFGYNKFCDTEIDKVSPQLVKGLNDVECATSGSHHTICKTYSNEFYSWGFNYFGQLGQGNNKSSNKPLKCTNWPENIIGVVCGTNHSILLTSAGYLYAFGSNHCAQLGFKDKNIKIVNIPTLIKDIPLIKRLECGYGYSMCIDINDNLWVFGSNRLGQLGLGDKEDRYKPILNESLHDIIDLSSGGIHTFVKTINNEIYAFGNNKSSQFGIKTSEGHQIIPIQVFKDNEDIWTSNSRRSKQKSARK